MNLLIWMKYQNKCLDAFNPLCCIAYVGVGHLSICFATAAGDHLIMYKQVYLIWFRHHEHYRTQDPVLQVCATGSHLVLLGFVMFLCIQV